MTDHICTLRDPSKVLDWAMDALAKADSSEVRSILEVVWDHALGPVGAYVDLVTKTGQQIQAGGEEKLDRGPQPTSSGSGWCSSGCSRHQLTDRLSGSCGCVVYL